VTREITIETTETVFRHEAWPAATARCRECGGDSLLLPIGQIVSEFEIGASRLDRWLKEGHIHSQLSDRGGLAICVNTLMGLLEKQADTSEPAVRHSGNTGPEERGTVRSPAKDDRIHGSRRSS
jgi:hypothetical protein